MATNYPGGLDTTVSTHTDAGDSIVAIQAELGVNPSGAAATVAAAIAALNPTLVVSTNMATADATMTSNATWYDGASLSLVAGSYLLLGSIGVSAATNAFRTWQARLWDGTTQYASAAYTVTGTAGAGVHTFLLAQPVTLGSTTTVKVSANSSINSDVLKGTSFKGTYIIAVKYA